MTKRSSKKKKIYKEMAGTQKNVYSCQIVERVIFDWFGKLPAYEWGQF